MYIKSLAAKNLAEGWELEEVELDYNLTLLVGISGAGKTQILKSLDNLKRIINGEAVEGFEWKVVFELLGGRMYEWRGKFSVEEDYKQSSKERQIKPIEAKVKLPHLLLGNDSVELIEEYLVNIQSNRVIIERIKEQTLYKGDNMPRLSKDESTLHLFQEEALFSEIVQYFNYLLFKDQTRKVDHAILSEQEGRLFLLQGGIEAEQLKITGYNNVFKYSLVAEEVKHLIDSAFMDVFPEIEGISSRIYFTEDNKILKLRLKLKNSDTWIEQEQISSGMLRFLMLLIDLYLSPDGSIFLIDEIENSLGINCLDEYIHQLQHANRNIQIIATSHHPYIINNVPYQQWKIVERQGSKITAKDASEYQIGDNFSKQAAFVQLTKVLEDY